jgi:hypothetical protein
MIEKSGISMYARLDLTMKKLMVLLAANEQKSVVTADIVEKVCAHFPYLKYIYGQLASDLEYSTYTELEDKIVEIVRKAGPNGLTQGVLVNRLRHLGTRKAIDNSIKLLESLNEIKVQVFKAKNGKETTRVVAVA